jgi:glutamate racemase
MIGVFDSGHGGLTILRALVQQLPQRDFLYLGDHAHAPYGERTSVEIVALTRDALQALFDRGCKLVILACNTAAAVALRTLQQDWLPTVAPDHRILGVLVPTVEAVTGVPWLTTHPVARPDRARTLVVFATRRTVASNAYPEEINKRAPEITLVQQACPGLVHLIESDAPRDVLRDAVHGHVAALRKQLNGRKPDAVMLGCTHFPLVADLFAEALPRGIEVVSQPALVARSLTDYLARHAVLDAPASGRVAFLTTGEPERVSRLASTFFGDRVSFTKI